MSSVPRRRVILFFALALGGVLADLLTKTLVFRWLGMPGPGNRAWWIVPGFFGFETSLNEGALFGMGQGFSIVFAGLSIAAGVAVLIWAFYGGALHDRLLTIALGCITGGILGNLFDRLGLPGLRWNFPNELHRIGDPVYAVRDWILVMIGSYHWPNFNLADSLLVSGAGLLMCHAFFHNAQDA